jgi:hypothetical protein
MAKKAQTSQTAEKLPQQEVLPAESAKTAVVAANNNRNPMANVSSAADLDQFDTGLENVTSRDIIIPRITLLQALSPQLDKNKPEYIKGAASGDFCDVATGDIFKDTLKILPCYFAVVFLEWAPRSSGKGLQANHGMNPGIMDQCRRDEKNRMVLPNGNYIAETATYFVLNLQANNQRSFIPLSSTQLKASRNWMTLILRERVRRGDGSEFCPPIFYRAWTASVVSQSNNEGSWNGWKFSPAETVFELDPSKSLLAEAKDFMDQARAGLVQGDLSNFAEESERNTAPGDSAPM